MPLFLGGVLKRHSQENCSEKLKKNAYRLMEPCVKKIEVSPFFFYGGYLKAANRFFPFSHFRSGPYRGVIIGHLFSKDTNGDFATVHSFSVSTCQSIARTAGRHLGENFWGQYVVFLYDGHQKQSYLFPDPLGLFSAFYTETREGFFFASDLNLLLPLLKKTTLNHTYLTATVTASLGGMAASDQTPFEGIFEVRPGEGLVFSQADNQRCLFWNPVHYIDPARFSQEKILPTFLNCVAAWKNVSPNVCLHLSGGLDSTALLFALDHFKNNAQKAFAVTYSNKAISASDEIQHAERVSHLLGVELFRYSWETSYDFSFLSKDKQFLWNRPHNDFLMQDFDQKLESLVASCGDVVFWCGDGGDQLFCEGMPKGALVDYFVRKGNNGFFSNMMNLCTLYREPLPLFFQRTLKAYVRHKLGYDGFDAYILNKPTWFKGPIEGHTRLFQPPFLRDLAAVPPAKREHILEIYEGTLNTGDYEKHKKIPTIYPFYSQPLVELALAMPVYESYSRHMSRVPFRKAVGDFFNTNLVYRRSKGDTTGIIQFGLQENIKIIQKLILEGFNANSDNVDKVLLEMHLTKACRGDAESLYPIMNLIALEGWMQVWSRHKKST